MAGITFAGTTLSVDSKQYLNSNLGCEEKKIINLQNFHPEKWDYKLFIKFSGDSGDGEDILNHFNDLTSNPKLTLYFIQALIPTHERNFADIDYTRFTTNHKPTVNDYDLTWPFTLTLVTYEGGEELCRVSTSSSFKMTKPLIDAEYTFEASDSLTKELTGRNDLFIPNISVPKVTINAETLDYTKVVGYQYTDAYAKKTEELTTNAKVFDKMGNAAIYDIYLIQDTWYKKNRNLTAYCDAYIGIDPGANIEKQFEDSYYGTLLKYDALDYFLPAIHTVNVGRPEALSTKVNLVVQGDFWNKNFGAKYNDISLKYRTKLSSEDNWSDYSVITATKAGNTFAYNGQLSVNVPTDQSIEVEVVAIDLCLVPSILKGSTTVSKSIFDVGDGYYNVNGELCNNDNMVVSMKEVDADNHVVELYDCNENKISVKDYFVVGTYTGND